MRGETAVGRLLVLWAFGEMTIYGSLWSDLPDRGRWREGGREGGRERGKGGGSSLSAPRPRNHGELSGP